ncbi:MAG TPA: molybdenum cofactor guanylyltransferase [Virgibacillus sp.]|nr:molybdenum cofactor guanylyltransferase [Virgibacillus sp.]
MARNIVGIILAGGQSSRFGSPKAFVKKDNIPFYQYSWQAIKPFVSSTLIITNPLLEALFAKDNVPIKMVNDHNLYQGQGPLAGIYTAMDVLIAEWYMIVPVDVPFVEQWIFEWLITFIAEDVVAIIPVVNGKNEPLLSLYHYSLKKEIKKQLDKGERSMHQLLADKKVIYVPIEEEKPFTNINRQEDYQRFIQNKD